MVLAWEWLPDGLLSPQGVMVLLLVGYGTALWLFLRGAPKIYTVMASDVEVARSLCEEDLGLQRAEVPLHYYYSYEQALGLHDPLIAPQPPGAVPPSGLLVSTPEKYAVTFNCRGKTGQAGVGAVGLF